MVVVFRRPIDEGDEKITELKSTLLQQSTISVMKDNDRGAAKLMKALGSDHRLLILCALAQTELSVTEMSELLAISQSSVSQHLSVLKKQALITYRRESTTLYYSLNGNTAVRLIATLRDLFCRNGQ